VSVTAAAAAISWAGTAWSNPDASDRNGSLFSRVWVYVLNGVTR